MSDLFCVKIRRPPRSTRPDTIFPFPTRVRSPVAPAPGADATATAAADKPCAAPSVAPGVSDDKIVVGNISSISGPVPGLGATSLAGVQAYAAYRNSMGGVCGRQIEVKGADDGMDTGRYRANAEEMNGPVRSEERRVGKERVQYV